MAQQSNPRDAIREFTPKLIELTEDVVFGDIWERPELSKRDRSLIVVATLIALGKERQLVGHLNRALDNGLTVEEIKEVITHLAFYSGWPTAMTAATIFKEVLEKREG
ncbi:MAG TPA: carboxymuconolactone decarboxylase family protein [Alphaproteobacteria bacterium]|nr:carboxymuconolactone decarboxylase family protein [Alphaproteobacteria bacterium]